MLKNLKIYFAPLLLLLAATGVSSAFNPDNGRKSFGIFIDERRLSPELDSVVLSAKGTLTLHADLDESLQPSRVGFRVVIRHRSLAGGIMLFPWDEEYNPGVHFDAVDLQKILPKTRPGDQLIILVGDSSGAPNSFVLTVKGDGC